MKEKEINVDELIKILNDYKAMGKITGKTKIILSSDEEGNSYSPLMIFKNGMLNLSASKEAFILYPSSAYTKEMTEEDWASDDQVIAE